ncbi:MAG: DUF3427 domain-containing protein [Candidatus Eisenbacteria bacterium]|uniref:DUF3427 domain-containing protein n=1 Tax=Eiseniibacteriota bacterium TaxID=2212470 RepID=A0A933W1L8_UNCEI|nr:DUF3427 domain-containing protein [Candidatus Eisenbacteria bacterium]
MSNDLIPGLYEKVVTQALKEKLAGLSHSLKAYSDQLSSSDASARLVEHLQQRLRAALITLEDRKAGPAKQIELCNRVLQFIHSQLPELGQSDSGWNAEPVTGELLLAIVEHTPLAVAEAPKRPSIPLPESHLLVNARGEHGVGFELKRELESANQVDLLCSFLLWSGYRALQPALEAFLARHPRKMRVLTTVYMGATQPRVLEELHRLGAHVRVSYDTRRTRLHAKAWLFRRDSGFTTAYIGSSNLSAQALSDGLEWNVRVGSESVSVLRKFQATFEAYWNDPSFEGFDPERDGERLRAALRAERAGESASVLLDIHPYPYQAAILEALAAERQVHNRWRNLVVAATGTGKTVIAALDYRQFREGFREQHGRFPRLLFIAHRQEILTQARATFRHALRLAEFGELFVAGERPTNGDTVFASIQSLARLNLDELPSDGWDMVIVDEFHHAEAASYKRLLEHLRPQLLLGLTATPERADGADLLHWFDGHIAVELRLWDAIEQGLLAPFQYFGLKDSADLSTAWKRGRFDVSKLGELLSAHDVRARQILDAVRAYIADPCRMRAIGFCASKDHARFMAERFTNAGIASRVVLGDSTDREDSISALKDGRVQALFTVDVLSEGVDIPEVDTVLLLRPTESPTVFLQQIGRGLRIAHGKRCLTVLDLVSTPEREFRLDRNLRALVGGTRRGVLHQTEMGFPMLPPGCSIELTPDARDLVIANLKQALRAQRATLVREIRSLGVHATVADVLRETGWSLDELYRGRCLTALKRAAGLLAESTSAAVEELERGLARLVGLDDPAILQMVRHDASRAKPPSPSRAWAIVLSTLFKERGFAEPAACLASLWSHPNHLRELSELASVLLEDLKFVPIAQPERMGGLHVHCHYRQEQILAALTYGERSELTRVREGVYFLESPRLDLLFVTLKKDEKDFSPSTMYKDYVISPQLFHWQSQSQTAALSIKGQRNIKHEALKITPLLFVRTEDSDDRGETAPYLFLGPVQYVTHEGERPLSITWRLEHPIPAAFFEAARIAV